MILMIGGAFQGKLDFAREHLGVTDCFTCDGSEIDFSSGCVRKIETFAACHEDPVGYFEAHRDQWRDCVLIMEDIFCGVVPMGVENRLWRQKAGRLAQYLSREADRVSRIFCGLELRLK